MEHECPCLRRCFGERVGRSDDVGPDPPPAPPAEREGSAAHRGSDRTKKHSTPARRRGARLTKEESAAQLRSIPLPLAGGVRGGALGMSASELEGLHPPLRSDEELTCS